MATIWTWEWARWRYSIWILGVLSAIAISLSIALSFICYNGFNFFGLYILNFPHCNETAQQAILLLFSPMLATISAFIFAVSGFKDVDDIPFSRRRVIIGYMIWLIPNIFIPLFLFSNINNISNEVFRLSIVLFSFSIISLIPYFLFYIHSNLYSVLKLSFVIMMFPFIYTHKKFKSKRFFKLKDRIIAFSNLLIQSISENDYRTFSSGIKRVRILSIAIVEFHKSIPKAKDMIPDEKKNILLKLLVEIHQPLALRLLESQSIFRFEKLLKNVKEIADISMNYVEPDSKRNQLELDLMTQGVKRIGEICVKNNMKKETEEVIHILGFIGDSAIELEVNGTLLHPPVGEALRSLQFIGILNAQERMENLCFLCLNRIESIADLGSEYSSQYVIQNALKTHWVLSAYIYEFISEAREWLNETYESMLAEFKGHYMEAFTNAELELQNESFIDLSILRNYRGAIRDKNFES